MEIYSLKDMVRGWFIGGFTPSVLETDKFEVGVKRYTAGAVETTHVHKVSTEITLVVEGTVHIGGKVLHANDIIVLEPGEVSEFISETDSILVVVKLPSVSGDKYLC